MARTTIYSVRGETLDCATADAKRCTKENPEEWAMSPWESVTLTDGTKKLIPADQARELEMNGQVQPTSKRRR